MGVEITQDELNIFSKNGISEDDIRNTVNSYRSEGVSDEEIRAKFDKKLNSFQNPTQSESISNNQKTSESPENETQGKYTFENGVLKGGGVSHNVRIYWDKNGRIHYEDEDKRPKMNWFKRMGRKIQAGLMNANSWINEANPNSEAYKQKVNTILTLETLPMGLGKTATQWGAAKLTPFFGKAISKNVAEGAGAGLVGGGVYGGGNALIEGENPLTGALKGGITGLVGGGLTGGAIGKGIQLFRGNKLKNAAKNFKDMTPEEISNLQKMGKKYYKDYLEGTTLKKEGYGDIYFNSKNAGKNAAHNVDIYPDLKKQLKDSEVGNPTNDKQEADRYYDHLLNDKNGTKYDHEIEVINNKGNNYKMTKKIESDTNAGSQPAEYQTLSNDIITDNAENFNPTIIKSEDLKNITKKEVANSKREFKQDINDLKKEVQKSEYVTHRHKGHYWKQRVDDPLTQGIQEADVELNSILNEFKKDPTISNNPKKMEEFENRLAAKCTFPDDELTTEYYERFYRAMAEADEMNAKNVQYSALAGREQKTRGAVDTIARKVNQDVANEITDNKYLTRGYEVNKVQLDRMSPEEIQNLINSDDISDLSVTARALDINNDLANAKIPLYKLNKWASDGTPIGQAMQARSLLKMDTPAGAIQVMQGTIRKATPKKVNDIIDAVPDLVQAGEGGEQAINQVLKRVTKNERKYLVEKILDLKEKGTLDADNLIKIINKKYNVPEITVQDLEKVNELTSNIQAATDERSSEVAKGLLRKYIGDKIPRKRGDKLNTYRYTNMLLSPKSRVKDFLFTGLFQGEQALDEVLANSIDRTLTPLVKGIKARNGLHTKEWWQGLKKGFKEGAEDVKLGITTGRAGEGSRFDLPKSAQFEYKPFSEVDTTGMNGLQKAGAYINQGINNIMSPLEKVLNYTIRVPDRMFYEGKYASSIADMLAAQGETKPTEDIINQAVKEARDAVYQGDTWASNASLAIRNLLNGNFKSGFGKGQDYNTHIGDWTMPFVQTVANISEEGLKNTFGLPVGAAKFIKADTPEAIRDAELLMAKGIKGLGYGALGYRMGKGAIDSNIGENAYQENEISGMQPQSIGIGDYSFSLSNAPNMTIPMAIGRAFGEKGVNPQGFAQALLNTGSSIADMPALKAIGDMVDIATDGYGKKQTGAEIADKIIRNQGVNYISQLNPLGGLQRNIRNVIDPYGRELYTENTPQYVVNRLINGVPFASQTLPQKYNAIGEPVITNNIQNPLLRGVSEAIDLGIRNRKRNATYDAYKKLGEDVQDTDIQGKTNVPITKSKRSVQVNGEKYPLNNKQYSNYQREYGKIQTVLRNDFMQNPEFEQLSDEEKVKEISVLRQSVEEAVKIRQLGHEPTKKLKKYTEYILENYDNLLEEE